MLNSTFNPSRAKPRVQPSARLYAFRILAGLILASGLFVAGLAASFVGAFLAIGRNAFAAFSSMPTQSELYLAAITFAACVAFTAIAAYTLRG